MNGWPTGYDRRVYDTLDSTLAEAARLQPTLTAPVWILALEQTAARGRRGRSWSTPRGNFAATLMMPRRETPGVAALRSFVTSLALYRAFVATTGRADAFALKWPNDVLLKGGKVAGILLETVGEHLAIGIGVNLSHAPAASALEAGALPAVTLREAGVQIAPEDFLEVLAQEYAGLEEQFITYGFAPIRSAWLAHAARLGEVITARTMRDETVGVFEDVDATGNLILRTSDGLVPITAADVFF
ncbi:biotin--[acetyl-CoA-carboxylase] ligase [Sulfitobacter sp. S0837]|uniref:biotin--[acetyl-CoA-carboxylase] ligase n=1 Tax=Sulfitobacter maritimus TaxID=2741719 RepID=UPI0015821ABA|nr:biotin--[acetyl-CoA-carboxylase] ligase [Sulfitobacter maritimus]NUH66260.1 biotin--[acetyl-CoA-carboxylase] ligase [Sulfitobacter maritimus]